MRKGLLALCIAFTFLATPNLWAQRDVFANDATAAHRRVYFQCVDATDGITPETGEAGGQPQISTDGGAFTNTGIGTLTHAGNGRYYADVTQGAIATAGVWIETRYKSANTAECPGTSLDVKAYNGYDSVRLGLTALPNAAAEAAGGLYTRGTGAGQINQPANGLVDINIMRLLGTAAATPATAGVFEVNVKNWNNLPAVALPLVPAVAGRTLGVNAGGQAGVDFSNVGGTLDNSEIGADLISAAKIASDVRTELVGTPAGASIAADEAAIKAVLDAVQTVVLDLQTRIPYSTRKATSFQWPMKFVLASDHITPITSGAVPSCTRSIDAPNAFAGTSNTASAITSLGWSELTISTTDITGDHYMVLKCTASGADTYETVFKIQTP